MPQKPPSALGTTETKALHGEPFVSIQPAMRWMRFVGLWLTERRHLQESTASEHSV